jgi:hypothetical protein
LFSENIWGIGTLGNASEEFLSDLQNKVAPLWKK